MLGIKQTATAIDVIYESEIRRHVFARLLMATGPFIFTIGLILETTEKGIEND